MSTNSKCKILFGLALPLTLATGYASESHRLNESTLFIDIPAPIVEPVSAPQAANMVIDNEIFRMALADTNTDYNLSASVKNGVVTMDVPFTDRLQSQRMVDKMWQLRGVTQVKNERGVDLAATLPAITMVP